MKVRWAHDSLRLRITPSELQSILEGNPVTERFQLSGAPVWIIAIVPTKSATELLWVEGILRLCISREDRLRLASLETEGVYFERAGDPLVHYFIEKDFPCIHPRASDAMEKPSKTFTPPPGFEARKPTESER